MKHTVTKITAVFVFFATLGCSEQQFGIIEQEKIFGQQVDYNNKVDVLWVVDNSNSMLQHQQKIAEEVSAFINALNRTGMDYHMGVTTMDVSSSGEKGRLLAATGTPTVLTRSTSNMLSILQNRLQMGDGGSSVERGLEATKLALTEPLVSGTNKGFRRLSSDKAKGAVLAVIYLSNEDDESGSAVPNPVAFFDTNSVVNKYGDAQWVVSFIGTTPDDPTCSTVPWTKEDGLAFISLASHSGGGVSSICSGDFATALANIKGHILSMMTEYRFDKAPLESTIEVFINGVPVPKDPTNGWTYIQARRVLRFNGSAIPPIGSTIKVDYLPEGFGQ